MSNAPEPEIKITEGIKAVINDPGVVATAEKVLEAAFGDKFRPSPPVTPSTRGRTRGKNKRLRCLITSPALLVSADEVIE